MLILTLDNTETGIRFFDGSGRCVALIQLQGIRGSKVRLGLECDHLIVQKSSLGRRLTRAMVEQFRRHGRSAGLLVVRDAANRKAVKR